jgi:uncharacterized protein (DUF4415 family)
MTRKERLTKAESGARKPRGGGSASTGPPETSSTRSKGGRKTPHASASGKRARGQYLPLETIKISDFYRPLKKPVTLRLDADVLAWFKKDGRRYQTRINSALRKVMEREIKGSEK